MRYLPPSNCGKGASCLDEDSETFEPIIDPKEIQHVAIRFVIAEEGRLGRGEAEDTRGRSGAADIASRGRIIEVKSFGRPGELRTTGRLLFTPLQLLECERNPDYYVYIVENVAQRDPSKFEVRVLHGDNLRRLCAGAKPQRVYVPVRVADYAKLPRLAD